MSPGLGTILTAKGQRSLVPTRVRIYEHENRAIQSAVLGAFPENTIRSLEFYPVGRLGWSGARVFRVRAISGTGPSRYFYAKVGRQKIFKHESDSLQLIKDELTNYGKFREGIRQITPECFEGSEQCFIPADEFGADALRGLSASRECRVLCAAYGEAEDDRRNSTNEEPPLTLHDHLERRNAWHSDPARFARALEGIIVQIYDRIRNGWPAATSDAVVNWEKAYCDMPNYDYLRLDRLSEMIQATERGVLKSAKHRLIADLREVRACAERVINKGPSLKVKMRPVHGDLHQRNIVVHEMTDKAHPWVIDFGWTKINHAMIDYALLESSLTNFYFAHMITDGRLEVLRSNVLKSDLRFLKSCVPIERLYIKVVNAIRTAAKQEAPSNWPDEYFLSSMLISVGLISVHTARVPTLARHALWFAKKLRL